MLNYDNEVQSPDLKRLQQTQKAMLNEVKSFCERHDIAFFLVAGSALGAVRHGDMIPWDDDIDIGMLRSDYERFCELFVDSAPDGLFLQNERTENACFYSYAKVRKNDTFFYEAAGDELPIHQGIFIDVFPFDQLFASAWKDRLRVGALSLLNLVLVSSTVAICKSSNRLLVRCIRFFFYYIRPILPIRGLKRLRKRLLTLNHAAASDEVCCFELNGILNYKKAILPISAALPVKYVAFDGGTAPVPADVDFHLRRVFGDYMKLPPLESRQPMHSSRVEFDNDSMRSTRT